MKRSDAYTIITRFVKSGILKKDYVDKLKELRTLICSGKETDSDGTMILWVIAHESWLDESLKKDVSEMVQACHMGFDECDTGHWVQCVDCPYNKHFNWGD